MCQVAIAVLKDELREKGATASFLSQQEEARRLRLELSWVARPRYLPVTEPNPSCNNYSPIIHWVALPDIQVSFFSVVSLSLGDMTQSSQ
jgi:hypothetical protein